MIKCNHCDFECEDGQIKEFVDHVYASHEDKLKGGAPGFRPADHGKCTTKPRQRRRPPKKPAWFRPFGQRR